MILSFWTDRSGQTVQTQIRLLLEEQSDQGLHCLPFHVHPLDALLCGNIALFKISNNISIFSGVQIFRIFTVASVGQFSIPLKTGFLMKWLNVDYDSAVPCLFMPPTSKKLRGHIAFRLCVGACICLWFRLSRFLMHTISYEPCIKFHIWIPHEKIADLHFFFNLFSCPSYVPFWSYVSKKKKLNEILSARCLKKYLS